MAPQITDTDSTGSRFLWAAEFYKFVLNVSFIIHGAHFDILTSVPLTGHPNSLVLLSFGESLKVPNAEPSSLGLAWIINPRNSLTSLSTPLPFKLLALITTKNQWHSSDIDSITKIWAFLTIYRCSSDVTGIFNVDRERRRSDLGGGAPMLRNQLNVRIADLW